MDFTCLYLYFETEIAYHKINLRVIKCKNVSFDNSFKNILGNHQGRNVGEKKQLSKLVRFRSKGSL
jgi:hypothetical protein